MLKFWWKFKMLLKPFWEVLELSRLFQLSFELQNTAIQHLLNLIVLPGLATQIETSWIETGRWTLTNSITRVQQTRNLEFVILSVIFEGSKHLEQGNQDVKSGHRFLRTCCDFAIFLGVFCGQRNQKTMGFNRFVGVQAQPYPSDNSFART